jgi:tRNA-splicing ligase RtcB
MNGANPKKVSQKAKSRAKNHLGTLGSGNHFIEIQIVEEIFDENIAKAFSLEKNQILIMIHSGSRGLGHQVAKDYIEKIDKTYNLDIPDKNLCYAPINSLIGQDYLSAMKCCANFAWANRQMMTYHIREALKKVFLKSEAKLLYDVCHNIAKFETHIIDGKKMELCVHRKGATRAFPPNHSQIPQKYKKVGQPVILPGSMGTNSYILAGQEESMQKTFGSCAHGSGRAYSRSLAQETFKIEEIKSDLKSKEIAVLGPDNKVLLQEGPSAYKNINDVVEVIKAENIAKPVAKLRPIGVIKG